MCAKRLPSSEPSSSFSAPLPSRPTVRPVLVGVQLLLTLLLTAAHLEGQRVGVGFDVSTPRTTSQTHSSVWFGVTQGLHGFWFSSGMSGGLVNHRYGMRGAHRGWQRNRDSYHHYGYGYRGSSCWDLLWNPRSSDWRRCPTGWAAASWLPYPSAAWAWYPSYPSYHTSHRSLGLHGWSVGVHLSLGTYWGTDPYAWHPFDPWSYGWNRYPWHSPRLDSRTIYVDTRPRWVVSLTPHAVRAGLSPRVGSGSWVSQPHKENPRPSVTRVRTPTERMSSQSKPVTRSAVFRQATSRAEPRSPVAAVRPVGRGAVARTELERAASKTPTPEIHTDRAIARHREPLATGTSRPIVIRSLGSRTQSSSARSHGSGTRRPTGQATTRPSGQDRTARSANPRPTGQLRAPTRATAQSTTRSRSGTIQSAPRARPSPSSGTRSPPQKTNLSRPSSAGSNGGANPRPGD